MFNRPRYASQRTEADHEEASTAVTRLHIKEMDTRTTRGMASWPGGLLFLMMPTNFGM